MIADIYSWKKAAVGLACALTLIAGTPTIAATKQEQEIAILLNAFDQDDNVKGQISAAKKLAKTGGDKALRALSSALFQKADPVASACLDALAQYHAGKGLEVAIQCLNAPKNRCSPRLKSKATRTAKALWKKSLRAKGVFKEQTLRFRVEVDIDESIPKKERWTRHINAEILEALTADPNVKIGDEIDIFSHDGPSESWTPQDSVVLLVRGTITGVRRKGSADGTFTYTAKSGPFEVLLPDLKGKTKRFPPIKGSEKSEDAESLDSRMIKLSLTDLARKLASSIHLWSRAKTFPFEESL